MLIQMTIAQLKAVHSKQRNQKAVKNQVTKLGANWNNASNASAFYWNLNNVSSNRNRNISSQAVNAHKPKTPLSSLDGGVYHTETRQPCHLAKHISPEQCSGNYIINCIGRLSLIRDKSKVQFSAYKNNQ